MALTEREEKLLKLVKALPYENNTPYADQGSLAGLGVLLGARENGCVDAVIELINKNPDKNLNEIWREIIENKLFAEVEFTDDDEEEDYDDGLRKAE